LYFQACQEECYAVRLSGTATNRHYLIQVKECHGIQSYTKAGSKRRESRGMQHYRISGLGEGRTELSSAARKEASKAGEAVFSGGAMRYGT